MLKKIGFVGAAAFAGMALFGGVASAQGTVGVNGPADWQGGGDNGQVGLVNLNNIDVAHNVNVTGGICGNDVNVLGVQVPVRDALNGIGVPVLSPGENGASGLSPYNCASSGVSDGGTSQGH